MTTPVRQQTEAAPNSERTVATGGASGRRKLLAVVGLASLAAACGSITTASAPSTSGSSTAAPTSTGAAGATTGTAAGSDEAWLYLTILTGGMIGKKGWPEYVPALFTVPANSTVHAEIRCYDDGPATIPSGYEKVTGTTNGSITVVSAITGDISSAKSKTVQSLDPKNVAHTLTFADLGLSVPVPPLSTVRFTFTTKGAGTHGWQCMASCGTGTTGWSGPMATAGWMKGTMTVQA